MVVRHNVAGYEKFLQFMENLKVDAPVFVLYSGTKMQNGKSWCSDCVQAEPIIEEALKSATENTHVVHVEVGERAFWKDLKCPFRTNPITKISSLPTLARWGTQKRLDRENLLNVDMIKMMLFDEDD